MNATIDISNVVLKTKRLILRPWVESDLNDFFEYASVDGVGQMAGWCPHKNIEESKVILNRFISNKRVFAIEYQGKAIGSIGIEEYDENEYKEFASKRCRSIGYVLSKDYWGQGFMTEAVKEVIKYLFIDVKLDVIICGHFLTNKRSERVQEKCGFKHYSYSVYETKFNTFEDEEINTLTKEDYFNSLKM